MNELIGENNTQPLNDCKKRRICYFRASRPSASCHFRPLPSTFIHLPSTSVCRLIRLHPFEETTCFNIDPYKTFERLPRYKFDVNGIVIDWTALKKQTNKQTNKQTKKKNMYFGNLELN